jgi:hypothetical protein
MIPSNKNKMLLWITDCKVKNPIIFTYNIEKNNVQGELVFPNFTINLFGKITPSKMVLSANLFPLINSSISPYITILFEITILDSYCIGSISFSEENKYKFYGLRYTEDNL